MENGGQAAPQKKSCNMNGILAAHLLIRRSISRMCLEQCTHKFTLCRMNICNIEIHELTNLNLDHQTRHHWLVGGGFFSPEPSGAPLDDSNDILLWFILFPSMHGTMKDTRLEISLRASMTEQIAPRGLDCN